MRRYDTVIFDLDGTLLNTLEDLADAVNYALTQMGWPARSLEEVRRFVGNGVANLMAQAVPAGTAPEETADCLARFRDRYAAHMADKTAPYPGILELLNTLREKGYQLAVVSNKFDAAVKGLVEDYFPGLFDAAAGESPATPKKPDPAMVFQAMAGLGAYGGRTVYVGDSDVDLATARNAGLDCISVTWGFRDGAFLLAHGAKTLCGTPEELLELLEGL